MKTTTIFSTGHLIHAHSIGHIKRRIYLHEHEHEGRAYALMAATMFICLIAMIFGLAFLAS
jgi:hypothetical protein